MLEWIVSWTFWNWLALVSFIVLPLSALNAFLGLRARYKDWRTLKSKEEYDKRRLEIEDRLTAIKLYNQSKHLFYLHLVNNAIPPLYSLLGSFLCLLLAGLIYISTSWIMSSFSPVSGLLLSIAIYLLKEPLLYLVELSNKVSMILAPDHFFKEITEFLKYGVQEKLLEREKMTTFTVLIKELSEKTTSEITKGADNSREAAKAPIKSKKSTP
jgi:hypothetical protein